MNSSSTRPKDSLWMSAVAAVFFIAWGLWINWEYGMRARVQVAITQGVVSFVSTLFSAELIVWLGQRLKEPRFPVIRNGTLSWIVFHTMIAAAHHFAGTPELFKTMMPGMVTGVFFCFGYAARVQRFIGK
ncbi:hypothetical protein N9F50_00920 [Akkermansiaceae bacterium]|nr:hypothetical protein [Akkermansiaceae bacterium]MDB4436111.1 hypothetical protein [Akkermansiaceae bacterium]